MMAVRCWRQRCGCSDDESGVVVAWFDGGAWRGAVVAVVSWDEGDEGGDEMMWRWRVTLVVLGGDDGGVVTKMGWCHRGEVDMKVVVPAGRRFRR
nr:hypothetical protein [Tanacetum cinerariifolium]